MKKQLYFLILIIVLVVVAFVFQRNRKRFIFNEGFIYGTIYHFSYEAPEGKDLKMRIEKALRDLDMSASTYKEKSIISRINRNDSTVEVDRHFETVYKKAHEISEKTNGAFDITIGPLVNLWGFGPDKAHEVDSTKIDSIRNLVGFEKIKLIGKKLVKNNPNINLNMNAIAKGYAVDLVAEFLEAKGIKNFMVDIGGEVRTKGVNKDGKIWRIGIDKPIDDPTASDRQVQDILVLQDKAVATSGNYRNFYLKDGRKYSHTISAVTGGPIMHELLSVSVLANDCMTADGYATAFMVMGLEKSIKLVENTPEIDAYFIYSNKEGDTKIYYTEGIEANLLK